MATGTEPTVLTPVGADPAAASPYDGGGLRYLDVLPLADGRHRLYYEMTRTAPTSCAPSCASRMGLGGRYGPESAPAAGYRPGRRTGPAAPASR